MDQEATDELGRVQAHGFHPIAGFDAVVFPFEGYDISIGGDQAVI